MELPPTLCEWAETDPDASRIKMHLKPSGIDGRFQEAITRTLELVEEQDRSLEYFRSVNIFDQIVRATSPTYRRVNKFSKYRIL